MDLKCCVCMMANPCLRRSKDGSKMCKPCFFNAFESDVHSTIVSERLFEKGETVAIGASGGKDSTVLAYVMKKLNDEHDYGLKLLLLSIDEGITGYRDDSLETVKQNQRDYGLPLKILSYKDLYGWSMDEIVRLIGLRGNCTVCGVFRRQALDRGALLMSADKVVTGHNADDIAETVIMNVLRGDMARLARCTNAMTGQGEGLPRCKPFKFMFEREIVLYAHFKRLVYFSTECIYSPNAYRGHARAYIKELEAVRPRAILDIISSAERLRVAAERVTMPTLRTCSRCAYVSSQPLCKACLLLDGLNQGEPDLVLGRRRRVRQRPRRDSGNSATTRGPSNSSGVSVSGAAVDAGTSGDCECSQGSSAIGDDSAADNSQFCGQTLANRPVPDIEGLVLEKSGKFSQKD